MRISQFKPSQVRYLAGIRHVAVEIGRVHHERISFPMAQGIAHKQTGIFTEVFPPVEVDLPAGVVVIVDNHNLPRRLKDRIRVVAVFTLE